MKSPYRWLFVLLTALVVGGVGLWLGRLKQEETLRGFTPRADFLLLDDQNDFYGLAQLPKDHLLLLVLLPDRLDPALVRPFAFLSKRTEFWRNKQVETALLSKGNKEIARNFKRASGFTGRLLLDPSGTVGKRLGFWTDRTAEDQWGYALIDQKGGIYWRAQLSTPMDPANIEKEWREQKLKAGY